MKELQNKLNSDMFSSDGKTDKMLSESVIKTFDPNNIAILSGPIKTPYEYVQLEIVTEENEANLEFNQGESAY